MATKKKLNVKFLAIVLGSLAVGLAVLGGIALAQYRKDPVKHIRSGDELMAEGRPDKASQQYLRAIGKAPFEMAYYDKAIEAIESIQPQTEVEAVEEFNRLLSVLLSKAEKASPQNGLSAAEVRAETLGRVLDEARIYVWGQEFSELARRDRAYSDLARRFRMVDASMARVPAAERDARLAAAVRGFTLEAGWRAGLLQTDSQWIDTQQRLREAIELDPTHVPGWYGLLRGQLDRFERTLVDRGPRAARRELEDDDGFLDTLADARAAVGATSAPEIDLLELELDQIAFYANAVGDGPEDLIDAVDVAAMESIVGQVEALTSLPEWEARWRLEELRAAAIGVLTRTPSSKLAPGAANDWRSGGIELASAASDGILALDPDDGRALLRALEGVAIRDGEDPAWKATFDRSLEAAESATRLQVGLDALLVTTLHREAARARFGLAMANVVDRAAAGLPPDSEMIEAVESGMAAIEAAYADASSEETPLEVLKSRLQVAALRGAEAERLGDTTAAREYFQAGSRAASELRQQADLVLDIRTLDAARIVADARGDAGLVLELYSQALSRSPELAEDQEMRIRLAAMMIKSARIDEAAALIEDIERRATAEGDALMLAKVQELAVGMRQVDQGMDLSEVRGADLLAAETEAALRGDTAKRLELLEQVIVDDEVLPAVKSRALLRRASIHASDGNFDLARADAARVLEIEPGDAIAMILLETNADTGMLDRYRLLARNASSDPEEQDVAVATMIRSQLTTGDSMATAERAELSAEYDRLVASLRGMDDPAIDTMRFLADLALLEEDLDTATVLIERIAAAESARTSDTVVLQARVLDGSGDPEGAINVVRDAIRSAGLGTDGMYILLGDLLSARGERAEALDAYQNAFTQAPTRPLNALRLSGALMAAGRSDEALPVLRAARNAGRETATYLDRWLLQEMRAGNHRTAIRERRRRYQFAPTDFRNAAALAALLMESPKSRADVVWTPQSIRASGNRTAVVGEPRFDEVAWASLAPAERQQAVLSAVQERTQEAGSIIQRMLELDPTDPDVVVAAVAFLRQRAGADDREAVDLVEKTVATMRDEIAGIVDPKAREMNELRLARILAIQGELRMRTGDFDGARAIFDAAVALEGDRSSTVDTIIASRYLTSGRFADAIPHQARLLAEREAIGASPAECREIARRLVELYVALDDLDSAAPIVAQYFDVDDPTAADLISVAAFRFGQADAARKAQESTYPSLLDEAESLYVQALALQADDFLTAVKRATVAEYRWRWAEEADRGRLYTLVRRLLEDIVAQHADSWEARRYLVQILVAPDAGDSEADESAEERFLDALAQIRGYLDIDGNHVEARKMLIDTLRDRGDLRQAIDLAQAALDADPSNIDWSVRVGQLRAELREFDEAARQFGLLYQQTEDITFLRMQTMALAQRDPPRWDAVIDLARANGGQFARSSFLSGMYAAAMAATGRRDLALRNFESTYRASTKRDYETPQARWREQGMLAAPLPKLFPATEDGVRGLGLFLEVISDGNPSLSDLLAVAAAWQDLVEASDDEGVVERGRRAMVDVLRRASVLESEHPETYVAYLRLGVVFQALADCDESIAAFEQCVLLRPEASEAKNNLAYLLHNCDRDLERARALVDEAIRVRPKTAEFRDTLGLILMTLADRESDEAARTRLREQARDELVQAGRLGESPAPLIRLAELELTLGRPEAARSALLQAGDREPDPEQEAAIAELTARLDESG